MKSWKGLIYLAGLTFCSVFTIAIKNMLEGRPFIQWKRSPLCGLLDKSMYIDGLRTMPDLHASLLAYSFIYLFLPLIASGNIMDYTFLFIAMIVIMVFNAGTKIMLNCARIPDIIAGYIINCVGYGKKFTYKKSRTGDSLDDKAVFIDNIKLNQTIVREIFNIHILMFCIKVTN